MENIIIDEEFRLLLPRLDEDTFKALEENILAYGVRDPLVVWNDVLIDGYNRYKICTTHDLPFVTVNMEFSSRDEVLQWIIDNQISRRNLTSVELSHFRGLYFNAAKRMRGSSNQYTRESAIPQSGGKQNSLYTAKEIGKRFNVSKNTIERDAKVADALKSIEEISPEAKQKILSGEVPVDRSKLQRLSKAPAEEIEEVVNQINNGTYNRNDYRKKKDSNPVHDSFPAVLDVPDISTIYPASPVSKEISVYIEAITNQVSTGLNAMIKSLSKESDVAELKTSLKTFINSLEDLHKSIK